MFGRILLDPDPQTDSGEGGSPADAAGLAESMLSQLTPEQRAAPVTEDDGLNSGEGEGTHAQAAQSASANSGVGKAMSQAPPATPIRDQVAALGYDVTGFADDQAALQFLARQAQAGRDGEFYANLGRQVAPHAPQISQWLATQQQAQGPPKRNAWDPPEFDQRWANMVEVDQATGLIKSKPGFDPAIAQKVTAFAEYQDRLRTDPALMQQRIDARATEIARTEIRAQFEQYTTQQNVDRILATNAQWLYSRDATGNVQVAHDGRPVPSANGARYFSHVQRLNAAGIKDPIQLDTIARDLLRIDLQSAQAQAKPATPASRQATAKPNRNPLQSLPATQRDETAGATDPQREGISLRELLQQELAAEGVTDESIYQEVMGGPV